MLQNDILVLDRHQQLSVALERADFLLQFLHIVHRSLEDGSLVDAPILAANVATGALHVPW